MTELLAAVTNYAGKATDFIKSNLGTIAVGAGGVALGAAIGAAASSKVSNSVSSANSVRKSRKRTYTPSKKRRRRSNRYTPRTAGKRRDTSHRRLRYTKNGQPYIILGSGKAKFVKKSGARSAHKRPGGRY